jgi:hypothetical protein
MINSLVNVSTGRSDVAATNVSCIDILLSWHGLKIFMGSELSPCPPAARERQQNKRADENLHPIFFWNPGRNSRGNSEQKTHND